MSETGRKLDVEDVLSSIRRLVSEEARTPDTDEAPEKPAGDKLILTPSLRVPGDDVPAPTSEIEQRISDIESLVTSDLRNEAPAITPEDPAPEVAASEMFAQLSETMANPALQDPEPEPAEDDLGVLEVSSLDMPDEDFAAKLQAFSAKTEAAQPEADQELEPRDEPELTAMPEPAADPEPDLDPAPMAEVEPEPMLVASREEPVFETEISAEPEPEVADAPDFDVMPEATVEAEEAVNDDFPTDSPFQADYDVDTPPEPVFVSSAAQVEEPVAEASFDPKPEPPLKAPTIERPELLDDADEPVTEQTFDEPPLTAAAAPEFDLTSDDGGMIDEEMLREIVSDMVRSELQGELGDRITRNVRKLVRREIHRALASRDFE